MNKFRMFYLVFATGLAGPATAQTCAVGVNVNACAPEIAEISTWSQRFSTLRRDPTTNEPVADSEREYEISYAFAPSGRIRRAVVVGARGGRRGMFEEGTIDVLENGTLDFKVRRGSCPDHAADVHLFYKRDGARLTLDTQPTSTAPPENAFAAITSIFADGIGEMIRFSVDASFTKKVERTLLAAGHGILAPERAPKPDQPPTTWGCFDELFTTGTELPGF